MHILALKMPQNMPCRILEFLVFLGGYFYAASCTTADYCICAAH